MLDYRLHYAVMAGEERLEHATGVRRSGKPIRPHKALRIGRRRQRHT